ncbi:hypothetical protein ACFQE1_00195 [Halobium palmae]|uniref:Uncharacterized protein n=1 Tax=Halobium palmae TaxID=1776492 RepID=A0ABD5RTU7_9EURY
MTTNSPNRNQQKRNPKTESSGTIAIPPQVYAQVEALRQSGIVNMVTEVHAGLNHFDFIEARQWLESNPERYLKGINRGFKPTDANAVEEMDPHVLADSIPDQRPPSSRGDATTFHEKRLLDHLESLRRFDTEANTYYEDGSWRETAPLTEEELELADLFDIAADCEPRQCYRNALLTAATFGESHDLQYVEGYVMANSFTSPIKHAWVELNEKVVELTFPEGPVPESNAVYLGIEFPVEDVIAKIYNEGVAEPLVE